ncbi:hypothetical protein TVAG_282130 [Trichomonas vaginalis G3]|uniref:Importin N-terminal domain-containing protein n=1 Tax=Trichomonas vaginalis (strain ATCC PRA-98 / G3) TaxID=412133 RepID=A2E9S8_TRIV3|nr:armadillo (ARM) repeat-containing protein family [Trichomonas vaginalis G3]EAY10613.1 hypothetical protein TVAG_282130 [Trichomonas vaginalis G3]KAI5540865.1 armadillo (ARM) repeat-containing protein family [Trichomonas vaginalis G3]|eukprot:XP_001322836.1 hypothetical protein [Trichomonas vaginalis G3]
MEELLTQIEAALSSISDPDDRGRDTAKQKLGDFRHKQNVMDFVPIILRSKYSIQLRRIACQILEQHIKDMWLFSEEANKLEEIQILIQYIESNINDTEIFNDLQSILAEITLFDEFKTYKNFYTDIFSHSVPYYRALSTFATNLIEYKSEIAAFLQIRDDLIRNIPQLIQKVIEGFPALPAVKAFNSIVSFSSWDILKQANFNKIIDNVCPAAFVPIINTLLLQDIDKQTLKQGFNAISTIASSVEENILEITPLLTRYFKFFEEPDTISSLHHIHEALLKFEYIELSDYWEFFALHVSHDKSRKQLHAQTISKLLEIISYSIVVPPCYDDSETDSDDQQFAQQSAIICSLYRLDREPAFSFVFKIFNELLQDFNVDTFNSNIWLIYSMKKSNFSKVLLDLTKFFNQAIKEQPKNSCLMKGFLFTAREVLSSLKLNEKLLNYIFGNSLQLIKLSSMQYECVTLLDEFAKNGKLCQNTMAAISNSYLRPKSIKYLCHAAGLTDPQQSIGILNQTFADILSKGTFPEESVDKLSIYISGLAGLVQANSSAPCSYIVDHSSVLNQWFVELCSRFKATEDQNLLDIISNYAIIASYYGGSLITLLLENFMNISPKYATPDMFNAFQSLVRKETDNSLLENLKQNVIISTEVMFYNKIPLEKEVMDSVCQLLVFIAQNRFDFLYQDDILFLIYALIGSGYPAVVSTTLAAIFEAASKILNDVSFQSFSDNFWGILYNMLKVLISDASFIDIIEMSYALERISTVARPTVDGTLQIAQHLVHDFPSCNHIIKPQLIKDLISGDRKIILSLLLYVVSVARDIQLDTLSNIIERRKFRLKYV